MTIPAADNLRAIKRYLDREMPRPVVMFDEDGPFARRENLVEKAEMVFRPYLSVVYLPPGTTATIALHELGHAKTLRGWRSTRNSVQSHLGATELLAWREAIRWSEQLAIPLDFDIIHRCLRSYEFESCYIDNFLRRYSLEYRARYSHSKG